MMTPQTTKSFMLGMFHVASIEQKLRMEDIWQKFMKGVEEKTGMSFLDKSIEDVLVHVSASEMADLVDEMVKAR